MPPEEATVKHRPAVVCRADGTDCDDLDLKLSRLWLRVAIAAVFAGQGMVFSLALNMTPPSYGSTAYWVLHGGLIFSTVVVMVFLGGPLFTSTWRMMSSRRLSIEGLFTLSLSGAFLGSVAGSVSGQGDVFYEIVSIVIAIYTFGRMLGERSQAKLQAESAALKGRFDQALRVLPGGAVERVSVHEVQVGDVVRVNPGEAFSVDGIVRSGGGYVRENALTGEPLPVVRHVGERVRAGTYSEDGSFEVKVVAAVGCRELDRILDAVHASDGVPSELQVQANQLMQYFLPLVAGVAILTAIFWGWAGTWMDAVFNSMAVLLVACPCALGLATPVAIWQGLYHMARLGLVSRDGAFVDRLAAAKTIYLDKTGTLSESEMLLGEVLVHDQFSEKRDELIAAIIAVESRCSHPIARTIQRELGAENTELPDVKDWQVIPGVGVAGEVWIDGAPRRLLVGELAQAGGDGLGRFEQKLRMQKGKRVYAFLGEKPAAILVLNERARGGLKALWEGFSKLAIKPVVLTGDPDPDLELPDHLIVRKGLSSAEKKRIVLDAVEAGEAPCFVGDGINDASAMAAASSSIAMGTGTALANSTASAHLRDDRIEAIPQSIALARGIRRRLRGNLIYAASYNLLGMTLAAAGLLHPIAAALIMLVSSFFVTLRALHSGSPNLLED